MDCKISVIIPVYNAERYLRRCLDSLRGQSLREIEILCVDDGSTDGSGGILAACAAEDSRIRLLRQENLGAGAARNAGIAAASGKYLFFMDADDFVTEDGLRDAYALAERRRADVLRCRVHDYDNITGEISDSPHNALRLVPGVFLGKVLNFRCFYFLFPRICAAPWGGIIRRDFVLDRDLRFNTLPCVNDRSFFWESVFGARRIVLADFFLLYYRTNISTSLVGGRIRRFDCHFRSYRLIEEACRSFPRRMRRCVLNGEMLDIANWLEKGVQTELGKQVCDMTLAFLAEMDKSPWGGNIEDTKWYRRIAACRERI